MLLRFNYVVHEQSQRGHKGSRPPPPDIGFLCNIGTDPLENHKATNFRPPSARQRSAI